MNNQVIDTNKKYELNISKWIQQNNNGGLTNPKEIQRFKSNALALINNQSLKAVNDKNTILASAYQATLLELPLEQNFGYCWVVPYSNKGILQAQFQMGYKGYIQLALRSQQYKDINISDVRDGELKKVDRIKGIKFNWIQDENLRLKAKVVGYVASFKLKNGFYKELYMSKEQVEQHFLKYSKTYAKNKKFLVSDFDSMALKTVLTQLLRKWGIMSVDLQQAYEADQAVLNGQDKDYIDNPNSNSYELKKENKEKTIDVKANDLPLFENESINKVFTDEEEDLLRQAQEIDNLELE